MSDYEEPESYPAISGNGSPLIDTWIAIRVAEYNHLRAEVERLTVNLKLCKDDSTEMDRRRLAEDARLRAENTRLREELIRMIDTFSGMGSAIPGPAFGSGAIKKARAALMAVQE